MRLRRSSFGLALALATTTALPCANADSFPSRPLRLMVGFPLGAAGDTIARVVGASMSQSLKQQIVVENRPGAGTTLAAELVARSSADGYSLFLCQVATLTAAVTSPNIRFDLAKDFAPITLLASDPMILAVHPSLGVSDVKGLIALAKAKPGELTYASVGPGTINHLLPELLALRTGTKLVHVPYKGSPPAATDLVAGRVSMMMGPASVLMPHVATGGLKALATGSARRLQSAPDLLTISEQGWPELQGEIWAGLVAPAGAPHEVIEKLADAANKAVRSDDVASTLNALGFYPLGGSPAGFSQFIAREINKWSAAAKAAGLKE